MARRVRLWHALANGFILDAYGRSTGTDIPGTATLRQVLPATAALPVVL
jgi:hypothetical protein